MPRVDDFFVLWNDGRVRDAVDNVTDDYWYQDAVLGGPHDRDAHIAIMERVLSMYPNRRAEVIRVTESADVEVVEYHWSGTSIEGEQLEADWVGVVDFAGNRMRSQRHYRGS